MKRRVFAVAARNTARIRFLAVAGLLLFECALPRTVAAATKPRVWARVPEGMVEYNKEEIFVPAFSIATDAWVENPDDPPCPVPTVAQYLRAARHAAIRPSDAFEFLQTPPEDACTWNREVLEAEGIDGHVYFAGLGAHRPRELEFTAGGAAARDSVSKIHSNIYSFWGEEYKPSPRKRRCVDNGTGAFIPAVVTGDGAELKTRRDDASRTKMTIPPGSQVGVIHREGEWVFIEAAGVHPCQPDPAWTTFKDFGWIHRALLK